MPLFRIQPSNMILVIFSATNPLEAVHKIFDAKNQISHPRNTIKCVALSPWNSSWDLSQVQIAGMKLLCFSPVKTKLQNFVFFFLSPS